MKVHKLNSADVLKIETPVFRLRSNTVFSVDSSYYSCHIIKYWAMYKPGSHFIPFTLRLHQMHVALSFPLLNYEISLYLWSCSSAVSDIEKSLNLLVFAIWLFLRCCNWSLVLQHLAVSGTLSIYKYKSHRILSRLELIFLRLHKENLTRTYRPGSIKTGKKILKQNLKFLTI